MGQDDRRLDLVAVLTSRARAADCPEVAFGGQRSGIEPGGMEAGCVERLPLLRDRVMSAHDFYRLENGKTPQWVPAPCQNRPASVVLGSGWHLSAAGLCRLLPAQ
jgi:hypothetical protein